MHTQPALSVDAKEICSLLEQAVLRYFPQPIVDVDNFLFVANGDNSAIEHPERGD
jgi:hypothetical protein